MTEATIVKTVAIENAATTATIANVFASAAGYIRSGISTSHGPNANIKNRIQGVNERFFDCEFAVLSSSTVSYTHLTLPTKRIV